MRVRRPALSLLLLLAFVPHPLEASSRETAGAPRSSLKSAPAGVEQYLAIRTATVAGLSPDAKTVAFLTNTTGSNQIWTIPAEGGWPEQITFFSDRVSSVSWSPQGNWIAFSKDSGGDENFQLYLVSPDGSRLVQLTDAPSVRHNLGGWSKDGRRLAFASNARNKKFFDVYMLDVDTGESQAALRAGRTVLCGAFLQRREEHHSRSGQREPRQRPVPPPSTERLGGASTRPRAPHAS
jgi:dipeptidyl aminopeptidase/acylaminoacyl peptidase